MRECPDGFYGDEDSQECEECHSDCRKCSGPEDSDCDSCGDGFTLDNGACVPEQDVCPAQTYLTGKSNTSERKNVLFRDCLFVALEMLTLSHGIVQIMWL